MTAKSAKASKKTGPKRARKPAAKKAGKARKAPVAGKKKATGAKKTAKKTTKKTVKKTKAASTRRAVRQPRRAATRPAKRPGLKPLAKKWWPFRDLLMERQRELTQAYNTSKGDSRSRFDDGTEDYIDYAVSSYAREFLLSLTELDRKQLMLVEEALRRLQTGEYGRCLNCGEHIATKRLQVAPWVRYCVRCQELDEQGLLSDIDVGAGDEDEDADEFDIFDDDGDYDEEDEDLEEDDDSDTPVADGTEGGLDLEDDKD